MSKKIADKAETPLGNILESDDNDTSGDPVLNRQWSLGWLPL